ncbi:hypothetical protein KDN24_06320 [Bacillus sp. Bva_UNVM-123]|uniref:hypothetical protein n=1 Tax=Bacillus sp. Bva_UNVM-123 TaxID=2829798 RepID=UPI00391F7C33
MNHKTCFENTLDRYVPTFTFNFKGDGRNSLGFRKIDELTDDYVVLSDSISTLRLYFNTLKSGNILINNVEITVFYYPEYPNHRFIPIDKFENRKYLIELLEENKSDDLLMMGFK